MQSTNPLSIRGIEFVEYVTTQPLALGTFLERTGFRPVARHRSREVMLYRQGDINIVVNASPEAPFNASSAVGTTHIGAIALRVENAAAAFRTTVANGAWEVPTHAREMELNIPAIRGPGDSEIYFTDRFGDFSIWDVDFVKLPNASQIVPSAQGESVFGIVQLVTPGRLAAWEDFYRSLFGFVTIPPGTFFGVVNKGELLKSPCGTFFWQLIEPPEGSEDVAWDEALVRLGVGTRDVAATQAAWEANGVRFLPVKTQNASTQRGAVTEITAGGACIELVLTPKAQA